jgi:hypothetical protein
MGLATPMWAASEKNVSPMAKVARKPSVGLDTGVVLHDAPSALTDARAASLVSEVHPPCNPAAIPGPKPGTKSVRHNRWGIRQIGNA